jgi:hypothetical protein
MHNNLKNFLTGIAVGFTLLITTDLLCKGGDFDIRALLVSVALSFCLFKALGGVRE